MEFVVLEMDVKENKAGEFEFLFDLADKGPNPVAPVDQKFTLTGKAISYPNGLLRVSGVITKTAEPAKPVASVVAPTPVAAIPVPPIVPPEPPKV